tara:strand:- start:84 stop:263 length:180 start_codon:yes stop_codon:yes gene_type:complete
MATGPRKGLMKASPKATIIASGANNILKVKTTRFPDHVYNLDPERYKDKKNKILKIKKV